MIRYTLAQIVIQTSVNNLLLILVKSVAKSVALTRAALFVHMNLVLNASKLLEFVLRFRFVLSIRCREIVSSALADVNLPITSCLRAPDVTVQQAPTVGGAKQVRCWRHSVLCCVLVSALSFDLGHVAGSKESFLVITVRYSILIEVNRVVWNFVRGSSGGDEWRLDVVTVFRVNRHRFAREANTEFRHVPLFAV